MVGTVSEEIAKEMVTSFVKDFNIEQRSFKHISRLLIGFFYDDDDDDGDDGVGDDDDDDDGDDGDDDDDDDDDDSLYTVDVIHSLRHVEMCHAPLSHHLAPVLCVVNSVHCTVHMVKSVQLLIFLCNCVTTSYTPYNLKLNP